MQTKWSRELPAALLAFQRYWCRPPQKFLWWAIARRSVRLNPSNMRSVPENQLGRPLERMRWLRQLQGLLSQLATTAWATKGMLHSSSSDGEDDFAHRVRLAHSFECGARDARLAAGLSDEPLETQAPSGPLSRRAYASGARAAEVAAKVEAQMLAWQAATQPEVQVSSGLSVTVTPKVPAGANRYPDELVALAPTPTRGMLEEPAKRPPSICTDLPEAGPCMVPAPQHRMQHARVVAHYLFTR